MPTAKPTSWGHVAEWYDSHLEDAHSYHTQVIIPNLLRLVEAKPGQTILDLACGTGAVARAIFEAYQKINTTVMGVDVAPELVAIAKQKSPAKITFHTAPSHQLNAIANQSVDTVLCVLALQNIEKLNETVAECARVLKPHGRLLLVLNHPAFRIPKQSSWEWDEKNKKQYRRLDAYLTEHRETIDMHPGQKTKEVTVSFHRPLQVYSKALVKHGLVTRRLEEWISDRVTTPGPRAKAIDISRKEFPLFLFLETVLLPRA